MKQQNSFKELNSSGSKMKLKNGLIWDKDEKKLYENEKEIKLTKYEILLFELLASKKNRVFSSDEIALYLWDDIIDLENSSKLKDIIKRLRKKTSKRYHREHLWRWI